MLLRFCLKKLFAVFIPMEAVRNDRANKTNTEVAAMLPYTFMNIHKDMTLSEIFWANQ